MRIFIPTICLALILNQGIALCESNNNSVCGFIVNVNGSRIKAVANEGSWTDNSVIEIVDGDNTYKGNAIVIKFTEAIAYLDITAEQIPIYGGDVVSINCSIDVIRKTWKSGQEFSKKKDDLKLKEIESWNRYQMSQWQQGGSSTAIRDGSGKVIGSINRYSGTTTITNSKAQVVMSIGDGSTARSQQNSMSISPIPSSPYDLIPSDKKPILPVPSDLGYDQKVPGRGGLYGVRRGNKWGYINDRNEIVTDIIYDHVDIFGMYNQVEIVDVDYKYSLVAIGNEWFMIDRNGNRASDSYKSGKHKTIAGGQRANGYTCQEGGCIQGTYFELIADDHKIHFDPVYGNSTKYTLDGKPYWPKRFKKGKYGFTDSNDEIIIKAIYKNAKEFGEGLAPVQDVSGKWGYIDVIGNIKIPFGFDDAEKFHRGVARVMNDGKWGLIDFSGKYVISPKYDYIFDYPYTKIKVRLDGEISYIDATNVQIK